MKTILERQLSFLIKRYITESLKLGNNTYLKELMVKIIDTTTLLQNRKCLFPANQLVKYKKIDYSKYTENIELLAQDVKIIFEIIHDLETNIDSLEKYSLLASGFNNSTITRLAREIDILRANTITKYHSYIETFKDNGNVGTIKNLVVDSAIQGIYLKNNDKAKPLLPEDARVIPSITSEHRYERLNITGHKSPMVASEIIGWESGKEVEFRITSKHREPITFSLAVEPTREIIANSLTIYPDMTELVPSKIMIYIDGNTTPVFTKDYLFSNQPMRIQFQESLITKIVIEMFKSNEDMTYDNINEYVFRFNGIKLENRLYSDDGELISKALSITNDDEPMTYTKLAMITTDFIPEGTTVNYYVSSDSEFWHQIVPLNHGNDPRNIIDFSNSSAYTIENITSSATSPWSTLAPVKTFGSQPVYNLLENQDDVILTDGAIANVNGDILPETVEVYRGIGDYSVIYEDGKIEAEISNVPHIFYGVEHKIDLCILVTEEQIVGTDRKIDTKYPIAFVGYILPKVTKLVGSRLFDCEVEIISDELYATVDSTATTGDLVTITYSAPLRDIEEIDNTIIDIDRSSIVVSTTIDGTREIGENDFNFNVHNKFIELSRISSIASDASGLGTKTLFISFRYLTRRRDNYRIFRTYVDLKKEYEITIFPFSDEETIAGNYHKIDGIDISKYKKYTLTVGKHLIETTQPHKTDPNGSLDVNDLTQKSSNAGIDLTDVDPKNRRAFEKPLRRVNIKKLSNVISPMDHKSFALEDNKIYLNFIPEELPSNLNTFPHLSASNVIGKVPVYSTSNERDILYYENLPETFLVSFQTKQPIEELQSFYYKIEMYRNANNSHETPIVSRLTINLI